MELLKIVAMTYVALCMVWFLASALLQRTMWPKMPLVIAIGDCVGVFVGVVWVIRAAL